MNNDLLGRLSIKKISMCKLKFIYAEFNFLVNNH